MKSRSVSVLCILSVLLFAASSASANSIRADKGASGKGQVFTDGTCNASSSLNIIPCVSFSQVSTDQATWTNFVLSASNTIIPDGPYDLFRVTTTGPVTLQFLPGVDAVFGSFLCGFQDDMSAQLGGFCTNLGTDVDAGSDLSAFLSANPSSADAAGKATFNFVQGATGLPQTWVFYATAGQATISTGSTNVPEPASFVLLGAGAAVLGLFRRRRIAA